MPFAFKDFDVTDFWSTAEYSHSDYVEPCPTDDVIAAVENELGYKLPWSFIDLMKSQNGGIVNKTCFPTPELTPCGDDHIAICGIFGIGSTKPYSLCGSRGSRFWIKEWKYPDHGVYICNTDTGGHDMVMLDYSICGPTGEPTVVHVENEKDNEVTFLAPSFEAFIRGLVGAEVYDTSAVDLKNDLDSIATGSFSRPLTAFFASKAGEGLANHFRKLLANLTRSKGYFALHQDDESMLVYDFQFYAYQKNGGPCTQSHYLKNYPSMIAFSDGAVSTKGYAPSYVAEWLAQRLKDGKLVQDDAGNICLTDPFEQALLSSLRTYT